MGKYWKTIFIHQMQALSNNQREEIFESINTLEQEGFAECEDGEWSPERDGGQIYKLKVKKEHADHRIFIDNRDGDLDIYGMFHRDRGYEDGYDEDQDPDDYIRNILSGIDWIS